MANVRELPHDLLAEKSSLGCLLLDGDSFEEISDLKIVPKDFYHPQYALIYEGILDLYSSSMPVDYVALSSWLQDRGNLEKIGGTEAIINLAEEQASSANIYFYAKTVKQKSLLRDILRTSMRVTERGLNFNGDVEDFILEVESQFFKLTNDAKGGKMVKMKACLIDNMRQLGEEGRAAGEIDGLPTGYLNLDKLLLGMQPGQLIILAARPAMGKTSLALNIAMNVCNTTQRAVAIFSLEMMATELSMRVLSGWAKVDSKKIRTKEFSAVDFENLSNALRVLSDFPIYINDSGDTTLVDIQSQCRKIQSENGLGLVVVDYLQLMSSVNKSLPREQQISELSRGLKTLAKEIGCPIIALSQLNRSVESRPNKRPNTADLRESGAIEQDADVVMFVYRDEYYDEHSKDPGVAEIIVGKNRGGETGTARLKWVGAYTSFENLANPQNEPKMITK